MNSEIYMQRRQTYLLVVSTKLYASRLPKDNALRQNFKIQVTLQYLNTEGVK